MTNTKERDELSKVVKHAIIGEYLAPNAMSAVERINWVLRDIDEYTDQQLNRIAFMSGLPIKTIRLWAEEGTTK